MLIAAIVECVAYRANRSEDMSIRRNRLKHRPVAIGELLSTSLIFGSSN